MRGAAAWCYLCARKTQFNYPRRQEATINLYDQILDVAHLGIVANMRLFYWFGVC
jgi:hypothetical protein